MNFKKMLKNHSQWMNFKKMQFPDLNFVREI
jgi:hypothetical protein